MADTPRLPECWQGPKRTCAEIVEQFNQVTGDNATYEELQAEFSNTDKDAADIWSPRACAQFDCIDGTNFSNTHCQGCAGLICGRPK